jgi:hypothetical protein
MNSTADLFFKYDYTETRELLKVLITLISATLVLSLTFAEKIVNFHKAHHTAHRCLIAAWILFVASIILCGVAMCLIVAAAGTIIYGSIPFITTDYFRLAVASWACVIVAGCAFVIGLIMMVGAAVISSREVVTETTRQGREPVDAAEQARSKREEAIP